MKTRGSGMPDEPYWNSFFDPDFILDALGLGPDIRSVVDFGCGYGTFAIPAARRIPGSVYALDIEPEMVAACQAHADASHLDNIICQQRDFIAQGTGVAENSVDFVMLMNILHAEQPTDLLREAHRILAPGGRVCVIHWSYDATTPRGPSMAIRPRPEQCQEWLKSAGFDLLAPWIDLPPYHYGMVGQKMVLKE